MVLFGPPIVVISAWLAMRSAHRAWELDDDIQPSRLLFAVLAVVFGTVSLGAIDALGSAAGLAVVAFAVGLAGFASSMVGQRRASTRKR
jgi:hypothetical protein